MALRQMLNVDLSERGNRCVLTCMTPDGDYELIYDPANYREMGLAMIDIADRAMAREGIEVAGTAHRSATITLPTIRYGLRGFGSDE